MRTIKFRAWDKENNDMYEWDVLSQRRNLNEAIEMQDKGLWVLMQFTGLKDKNGKEIYEGDIVKLNYGIEVKGIVTFEGYQWKVKHGSKRWYSDPWSDVVNEEGKTASVLGNIYENPELLK